MQRVTGNTSETLCPTSTSGLCMMTVRYRPLSRTPRKLSPGGSGTPPVPTLFHLTATGTQASLHDGMKRQKKRQPTRHQEHLIPAIDDPADLGAQTRQALENLEIAVRAGGGTRTDIVSLRLYIVGEHIHNARSVRAALLGFFPAENLPTSTWIGVSALASKDFLIEIEAVAVLE
jgi:Endoribonuclease L-PSP